MKRRSSAIIVALTLILTVPGWAQQVFETSTKQRIRVVTMATGLVHPWSIAILPGGKTMLIGGRAGRLRIMRDGILDPKPVWEAPPPPAQMSNTLQGPDGLLYVATDLVSGGNAPDGMILRIEPVD